MESFNTEAQNIRNTIVEQLKYIGEDPNREGLVETPDRVVRSWEELYGGYKQNPVDIMKTFKDDPVDELILVKEMEFFSTCEHHALPFFGIMNIAYIPNGKVLGVSKLGRVADIFCRRLQIQERLVNQIANCIDDYLQPLGVMITCEAQHFCMMCRGIKKQNSKMVTSALRGVFKTNIETRQEFFNLVNGGTK